VSIADDRLAPGTLLDGRYRIVALVNAGGMGAVYRAEDQKLNNKTCAIKEMLDTFDKAGERQAGIDRFLSEVQVMESLKHVNIPRVTDRFVEKGKFYFVMEFIEGVDLGTLLDREGSPGLVPQTVFEWGVQACDALEYLHTQKPPIVHRDLKPSNLMVRAADNRILLIDFGISRVANPQTGWIGTSGYAPPEQQCGKHEPSSDLYALGATIHELITGKKPEGFFFDSFAELGIKGLPSGAWDVVSKALQAFPDERYASARAMRKGLIGLLGYEPQLSHDASFAFSQAVSTFKDETLDPLLRPLIRRYGNECHTPYLPRLLERLVFTLGHATPFELIIQVNEAKQTIEFYERQGILDPRLLGSLSPNEAQLADQCSALIERYLGDYEVFKDASWQI
jgi:serine/threonine protein kinase